MQRHSSDLATCYVGVSFYRTASGEELHTAVAQVFNERGDGVVVRGGTAQVSKSDRQPHLALSDARQLLLDALAEYRTTHGHQPARIVIHKSSNFTSGEIDGFHEAADLRDIDHVDLLWIQRRGAPHLYRTCTAPGNSHRCVAPVPNWTPVPCSCTPAAQCRTSTPIPACMSPSHY